LSNALRQYSNFNSIDIGGYKNMSIEMRDILVEALKARKMKEFHARVLILTHIFHNPLITSMLHFFQNKSQPFNVEALNEDVGKDQARGTSFKRQLGTGSSWSNVLHVLDHQKLSRATPSLIEHIDLGETSPHNTNLMDDLLANEILSRFNPENIRGCKLTFEEENGFATAEKRLALLQFLPLSKMSAITLQRARNTAYDPRNAK
jgi:hypothetical protein